jgi:hypothetical protein
MFTLTQRLGVILGSVVTLVTGLAVAVNTFVSQVAPELPQGWQDNALSIGAAVTSVLLSAAAAIRRVTEVPTQARGLNLPPEHELNVQVTFPGGSSGIKTTGGEDHYIDARG